MNAAALNAFIADTVRMMGYAGIEESVAYDKIRAATMTVMIAEMQGALGSTGKVIGTIKLITPEVVDPIVAPAATKTFKGTGKFFTDPKTNQQRELGTWINPAGDIEAARLTRETGVIHIVDPNTGDVVSMSDLPAVESSQIAAASGSPDTIGGAQTEVGIKPV